MGTRNTQTTLAALATNHPRAWPQPILMTPYQIVD